MHIEVPAIIVTLIVGGIAGWLAGLVVRGFGFGILGNIVVGIIGALIASWLLPKLGVVIAFGGHPYFTWIINALIGAIILLVILGLVRRV